MKLKNLFLFGLLLINLLYSDRLSDWLDITTHPKTQKKANNTYDITKSLPEALKKYKKIFFPSGIFLLKPTELNSDTYLKGMGQTTILKNFTKNLQKLGVEKLKRSY